MTPETLCRLIEAYGADPSRWPVESRSAAQELLARKDAQVLAALAKARDLDQALSEHLVAPPENALIQRIIASAPPPNTRVPVWGPLRWWLSGAGIVAVGVGGVAVGMLALPLLMPAPPPVPSVASSFDPTYATTIFGDTVIEGDEQ
jgi:hypothetical protein